MSNFEYKSVKQLFNLLQTLDIIKNIKTERKEIDGKQRIFVTGEVIKDRKRAVDKLVNYYLKLNNLKNEKA